MNFSDDSICNCTFLIQIEILKSSEEEKQFVLLSFRINCIAQHDRLRVKKNIARHWLLGKKVYMAKVCESARESIIQMN